ncbi:MAG: DUF177 domain-containing protein [Clostridiales bacterium]|nr:DUF177 domain-containing protein [Clostridiales bacterium]
MIVSDKIVIDLTENFASVGKPIPLLVDCKLGSDLLPYPNAALTKVLLDMEVTFVKPNVHIVGKIVCYVDGYCDKCLTEVSTQITLPFDQVFFKDSSVEEDGYVYSGSRLDLTKAICDEIVLSLPSSLLCKEGCLGLCPKCGVNLNERQCDCDTSRENAFSVLKNIKF